MYRQNSVVTSDEPRLFLLPLVVLGCVIIFLQLIKGHTFEIPCVICSFFHLIKIFYCHIIIAIGDNVLVIGKDNSW